MENKDESCCVRHRTSDRDPEELKDLACRIHRIQGQLSGIEKMLQQNLYCGDVLNQIAAAENALSALGYQVLKTHMETCMVEDVKEGKNEAVDEAWSLMKKLK